MHAFPGTLLFIVFGLAGGAAPTTAPATVGVDANYVIDMESHGRKWTVDRQPVDLFKYFGGGGQLFRVRLWTGDAGVNGLDYATETARRAQAAGMRPYLVLFLSENWADLVKQPTPAVWKDFDLTAKAKAVEAYAERVMRHFAAQGINIDFVEVGNEIDFGICGEFEEEWPKRVSLEYMRSRVWPRMTPLLLAAERGVRKARPKTEFVLHLAQWNNVEYCIEFWKRMIEAGVTVDYAGLSYFPTSDANPEHRAFEFLQKQIAGIRKAVKKRTIICETGYPCKPRFDGQFAEWNKPVAGYELNEAGQAKWLGDFLKISGSDANVASFFYWSPEWFDGGLWDAFALFDAEGRARPAAKRLLESGCSATPPSVPAPRQRAPTPVRRGE